MRTAAGTIIRAALVLAAFVLLVILNVRVWQKDHKKEQQISALQQELAYQLEENAKVSAINEDLRLKVQSLSKSSKEAIEEKAREDFGMVREDETFYYFDESNNEAKVKQ